MERIADTQSTRRDFIQRGAFAAGAMILGAGRIAAEEPDKRPETKAEDENGGQEMEISPAEDLMREHGVLKRVLLIYDEGLRRLEAQQDLPPETIADSARLIRSFIEDYHEKLEEDFLFPRFRKAGQLTGLVDLLAAQHRAGRMLTDEIMRLATVQALKSSEDRRKLAMAMRQFIRMYEPHEAREDTVLFPALRRIVSLHEYDSLGEDFEKKEHELFGEEGFEKMVDRVAAIEKDLGIYDLAQFTPHF